MPVSGEMMPPFAQKARFNTWPLPCLALVGVPVERCNVWTGQSPLKNMRAPGTRNIFVLFFFHAAPVSPPKDE